MKICNQLTFTLLLLSLGVVDSDPHLDRRPTASAFCDQFDTLTAVVHMTAGNQRPGCLLFQTDHTGIAVRF